MKGRYPGYPMKVAFRFVYKLVEVSDGCGNSRDTSPPVPEVRAWASGEDRQIRIARCQCQGLLVTTLRGREYGWVMSLYLSRSGVNLGTGAAGSSQVMSFRMASFSPFRQS